MVPLAPATLMATTLLAALLAAPAPALGQGSSLPDPLPMTLLPEGRLLRVELVCGEVLWARMVHQTPVHAEVRLALVEGGVRVVPSEGVAGIRELPGTVRNARHWPGPSPAPVLLDPSRVEGLLTRGAGGWAAPSPSRVGDPMEGVPAGVPEGARVAGGRIRVLRPHAAAMATVEPLPGLALSAGGVAGGARAADGRGSTLLPMASVRYLALEAGRLQGSVEGLGALDPDRFLTGGKVSASMSWAATPARGHYLGVGSDGWVAGGTSWRPVRRWMGSVEVARDSRGETRGALGIRYLGGRLHLDAGVTLSPLPGGSPEGLQVGPVIQLRHVR